MEDKSKKRKKVPVREEDVSTLLLRYPVKTVLSLLQEVAKVAEQKIDWSRIVKNTAIGISSARECQMLWRHLAYGQTLSDQFDDDDDDDAEPMEDESDLEYEIESSPSVSREASVEAAAYVRVLMASDSPIDSHVPNNSTVEAPLTINVPKFKVPSDGSLFCSTMQGKNVSIPVSIEKEPLSSGGKRPKDGKSGVDSARRTKRKGRSTEDDLKLNAALQKHGEQNHANISSGDFKNDKNTSKLSNRWTIRGKKANLNAGTSSDLSEERMATTRAILIALEPDNLKAARQMANAGTTSLQYASSSPSNPQLNTVGPLKSQATTERPPVKCSTCPNPMVQAAAVAAGARIVTPADASSVIEATARSQNVIHIRTGDGAQMKSPTTSMLNQRSVNTHFSHNGPRKTPFPSYSAQTEQGNSIKPVHLPIRLKPSGGALVADVSSGMVHATASIPNTEAAKIEEPDEHLIPTLGGNRRGDRASSSISDPINQSNSR